MLGFGRLPSRNYNNYQRQHFTPLRVLRGMGRLSSLSTQSRPTGSVGALQTPAFDDYYVTCGFLIKTCTALGPVVSQPALPPCQTPLRNNSARATYRPLIQQQQAILVAKRGPLVLNSDRAHCARGFPFLAFPDDLFLKLARVWRGSFRPR